MDYTLAIFAFLATIIAILGETKQAERRGLKRIAIIASILIALSVLCLSVLKTHRDQNKINISDIHITLYAENVGASQPDSVILANAPEAFPVNYAFLGGYSARLDFSSIRGVDRPTGYRATDRATLVYHSINFRKNLLESDTEQPFSYIWDLNGKKLSFRIPVGRFIPIPKAMSQNKEEVKWRFKAELIIGDKIFEKKADESGAIEFIIEGI